jgi:hypothetical protein
MMSIRSKFFLATYILPFAGFAVFAALGGSPLGVVVFLGSFGCYCYVAFTTRCPQCQKLIRTRASCWGNSHWEFGLPLECENCGIPFHL